MKKKRTYKTVDVQQVELVRLLSLLPAMLAVVAIDVAKKRQVAAFCDPQGTKQILVKFEHPAQTPRFMELVGGLAATGKTVQVVMEPTGTYGDILCYQAQERGAEVYQISPKRTHDAAEVFDGVPSYHDAKDATVIARLHVQGLSRRWKPSDDQRRELRALVARRELYARQYEVLQGTLEALLARHWPEAEQVLEFRSQRSALRLLQTYPDPQLVAAAPDEVQKLLQKVGRRHLGPEMLKELMTAAEETQGVPLVEAERELLRDLAGELLRAAECITELDKQIKSKVSTEPRLGRMAALVGATTIAVLVAYLGNLWEYSNPAALEKAMGLNLKEASSGRESEKKRRPGVHITKRGPGLVRKYWYLASLRWMQQDWIAAAWYRQRKAYTAEAKGRAVVALMRKLIRGLWHVSRGACYDPERLFDAQRLRPCVSEEEQTVSQASLEVTM
jgi:transposase